MASSPMNLDDEHRKRRQPDHPGDEDVSADRKRLYQPSSSSKRSDLAYDSVAQARRAGLRLSDEDKEPPPGHRAAGHQNGQDADDVDEDPTVVEARLRLDAYRKDAIYRHFLQSKRELASVQERLFNREQRLREAEERIQAFDVFWDTLSEDVRLLFKDDAALQDVDRTEFLDAIPFTTAPLSRKAFTTTLEARTTATRAVLSRIAALAAKSAAPEVDALRAKCHERAGETALLKTSLASAQATLKSLSDELSDAREALVKAELRADRAQSGAVRLAEMSGQERAAEEAAKAEREALIADVERLKAERERQKTLPNGDRGEGGGEVKPANGPTDSAAREDSEKAKAEATARAELAERLNEVQTVSAKRLDELARLRSQLAEAEAQLSQLRRELTYIPEQAVRQSEVFKATDRHVVRLEQELELTEAKYQRMRKENEDLRERMIKHGDEVSRELSAELEKVKAALASRETDLARVRNMREELQAQLTERKSRDKDKFLGADENRRLLAAKEILLGVLANENRAWRLKDAARRGDQKAIDALIAQGGGSGVATTEPPTSVEDQLFTRLKAAEALAEERGRLLDAQALSHSDGDLARQLAHTRMELESLRRLLGGGDTATDAEADSVKARLGQQSEKIAELERLILAETTRADAACDDLDKMSQAYEEVAKSAEDRTKHLSMLEDRVIRLNTEKSKADNKYFAAMRTKEALEAERKLALRNTERQALVIQQLTDADKVRTSHATALETELSTAVRLRDELERRTQRLELQLANKSSESSSARERAELGERELHMLRKQRRELEQQLFVLEETRGQLEKQVKKAVAERDAAIAAKDKAQKRRNTVLEGGASTNTEAESLRALLRCSSCKDNFRERIITKCMHTFCAQCIDARIQTRQRKCPHCGIAFAQSDVQMLYLQ